MIQIKPYTALPARDEIKQAYLSLIARTLPFREADMTDGENPFPAGLFDRPKSKAKSMPNAKESRDLIRKYSRTLDAFLFDDDVKLRRFSLYKLLFSSMDEETLSKNGLDAIKNAADKNPEVEISRVFSYDRFSSSAAIHSFVQLLDVNVCPYCNRSFTTTLVKGKGSSLKTRPELDHYLSKQYHPYFALSILNLVPSCGTCNRLKSNKEDRILYPYAEGIGDNYRFETRSTGDLSYLAGAHVDFDLRLSPRKTVDREYETRAENSKRILGLERLYQAAHLDFVSDLFFQRYIFTDEMLDELYEQFKDEGLFKSPEELKELLYLRKIDENGWGERPLSKLVHDIDEEIKDLYSK